MAEDKKSKEGKESEGALSGLVIEGCKAYGIEPQNVFNSRIDKDTNEAVIVTMGGSKVRFRRGMEVKPLDPIRITGINPKPKRKPMTGK